MALATYPDSDIICNVRIASTIGLFLSSSDVNVISLTVQSSINGAAAFHGLIRLSRLKVGTLVQPRDNSGRKGKRNVEQIGVSELYKIKECT
jgi:hypothetical protein